MKPTLLKAVLISLVLLTTFGNLHAHEGEDHGTPELVVPAPGEELLAAMGSGAAFDAVLKYLPFIMGEQVALTLYLVSSDSNAPVADATIEANLSEGGKSTIVAFRPKAGGPVGAYSATVTPGTATRMSWLFDITAGSDSDLIGISGFQANDDAPGAAVGTTVPHVHEDSALRLAILFSLGTLLVISAFVVGRMTAGKKAAV